MLQGTNWISLPSAQFMQTPTPKGIRSSSVITARGSGQSLMMPGLSAHQFPIKCTTVQRVQPAPVRTGNQVGHRNFVDKQSRQFNLYIPNRCPIMYNRNVVPRYVKKKYFQAIPMKQNLSILNQANTIRYVQAKTRPPSHGQVYAAKIPDNQNAARPTASYCSWPTSIAPNPSFDPSAIQKQDIVKDEGFDLTAYMRI